jgi:CDP-glucose 4,6-dehydratase
MVEGARNDEVSFEDPRAVRAALERASPELVIHAAAHATVPLASAERDTIVRANVGASRSLLEGLLEAPKPVAFLVLSTERVFAPNSTFAAFGEDAPLGSVDPYGDSKAAMERDLEAFLALANQGRPSVAIARLVNVLGGGDVTPGRLVPDVMTALAEGRAPSLRQPDATRSYLHVADVVAGLVALGTGLLSQPKTHTGRWNFGGSPESIWSSAALAEDLRAVWEGGSPVGRAPHGPVRNLSSERAARMLGWAPRMRGVALLSALVHWYRPFHGGAPSANLRALCVDQLRAARLEVRALPTRT